MATYRPKTVAVKASDMNNGERTNAASASLLDWNRSLFMGTVRNASNSAMTNAAIQVIRRASATGATEAELGTVFTDTLGEYGVSLPTLTGDKAYTFEAYTPGD
ncbi:hypothetical protein [Tepidibacter sp. Z1-5]|uniref:hypothetical protein n=1 Tax=Tepidibacter sp. Z1-5 TaxID=3134138 RepID=UPI0030C4F088